MAERWVRRTSDEWRSGHDIGRLVKLFMNIHSPMV